MIHIREYKPEDERAWLECRVLSYLDSAYFDDVHQHKDSFTNPVIDLVAEDKNKIVGFIEIECETEVGALCAEGPVPAAMIWNIVVLPEYRRKGLAAGLLQEAKRIATERGIVRFEAYTRDDPSVLAWYRANGFKKVMSYLHVYLDADEVAGVIQSEIPGLKPLKIFAHYTGEDREKIQGQFKRVHECQLFELRF